MKPLHLVKSYIAKKPTYLSILSLHWKSINLHEINNVLTDCDSSFMDVEFCVKSEYRNLRSAWKKEETGQSKYKEKENKRWN